MNMKPIDWVAGLWMLVAVVQTARCSFYRAYFRQKQLNAGKNPDAELRKEFPLSWWIIR